MRMTTKTRKAFLRALAATNQTQSAWAQSQAISPAHLSLVLNGHRDSLTLTKKIAAFATGHAENATPEQAVA